MYVSLDKIWRTIFFKDPDDFCSQADFYTPAPPKVEWGHPGFTPISVRPSVRTGGSLPRVRRHDSLYLQTVEYDHWHLTVSFCVFSIDFAIFLEIFDISQTFYINYCDT